MSAWLVARGSEAKTLPPLNCKVQVKILSEDIKTPELATHMAHSDVLYYS